MMNVKWYEIQSPLLHKTNKTIIQIYEYRYNSFYYDSSNYLHLICNTRSTAKHDHIAKA